MKIRCNIKNIYISDTKPKKNEKEKKFKRKVNDQEENDKKDDPKKNDNKTIKPFLRRNSLTANSLVSIWFLWFR